MKWMTAAVLSLLAATAGCAGTMGGGSPLVYRAIAPNHLFQIIPDFA